MAVVVLAAMLSTAKSLRLTIASALAPDIIHKLLAPKLKPDGRWRAIVVTSGCR